MNRWECDNMSGICCSMVRTQVSQNVTLRKKKLLEFSLLTRVIVWDPPWSFSVYICISSVGTKPFFDTLGCWQITLCVACMCGEKKVRQRLQKYTCKKPVYLVHFGTSYSILYRPCRNPTKNTVENCFTNESIPHKLSSIKMIDATSLVMDKQQQAKQTIATNAPVIAVL